MPKYITPKAWEALCDGCGLCCELKETEPTGVACPIYDTIGRCCSDYDNRKERHPCCIKLTPKNINNPLVRSALPDSCGYIKWADDQPYEGYEYRNLLPFNIAAPDFQRRMQQAFKDMAPLTKMLDGN